MPVFEALPAAPEDGELPLVRWGEGSWSVLPWEREVADQGYNSHTWQVANGERRYVLKAVPKSHGAGFAAGLGVARGVAEQGILSGTPNTTTTGDLVVLEGDWCWGLLDYMDGERVDRTDAEQMRIVGGTLAAIHRALVDHPVPAGVITWPQIDWLLAENEALKPYPWIQRAMREALEVIPDDLTLGVVHGDPRVTEFRIKNGTGGLLDWGEVMYGPHVFDVASTLIYLDDEADKESFLRGYLATSVIDASQLAYVDVMRKFRYAVEAWFFAHRESLQITLGQEAGEHTNASILKMKHEDIEAVDAGRTKTSIPTV
ncbi:phosphotransferase enzyme family protein [Streptomyces minutiscleroticus]|uniref:Aminoglycoside phosphotransferase domain-containing protein n=1 Tax=Streptomyces minutiscleroticus TaxID=68238 RepID=A0A918NXI5_9ACTN|nr:phosphotransferase [Streptomyces minutiscleroticus]GGY04317.1 hypothetical protein GCM10010358_67320 [Streptomyces minutiscleroticus]